MKRDAANHWKVQALGRSLPAHRRDEPGRERTHPSRAGGWRWVSSSHFGSGRRGTTRGVILGAR